MMNEPAFPTDDIIRRDENGNLYGAPVSSIGLTKRELIAAMAMQGLFSNADIYNAVNFDEFPAISVKYADALLEALK